ncbi:hypothetical protein GQ53DRAFT_188421 [Thozetella sp. PMI_491]|nr:hypothetical protein GQ53DRAFT_188421 [Thozetella sp. PMI_491]
MLVVLRMYSVVHPSTTIHTHLCAALLHRVPLLSSTANRSTRHGRRPRPVRHTVRHGRIPTPNPHLPPRDRLSASDALQSCPRMLVGGWTRGRSVLVPLLGSMHPRSTREARGWERDIAAADQDAKSVASLQHQQIEVPRMSHPQSHPYHTPAPRPRRS